MNEIETGGPAFPVNELNQETGDICAQHFGVSVRDYFAAKAMTGCCANGDGSLGGDGSPDAVARWSYEIADAMLAARSKA